MPIIATILAGNNASIVRESVQSVVPFVDRVLLIDTGSTDGTSDIVRESAGDRFECIHYPWRQDFAAARNFSLQIAAKYGSNWVMTVDTDERFTFDGIATRAELQHHLDSNPRIRAWMVSCRDGSYAKERFIRLPTTLEWRGRTIY